jgi:two-component system cell cycle sensor histidine kinase/response regulator CckA
MTREKARILIVDDEPVILQTLADLLRREGYAIVGLLTSGDAARREAARLKPDLIIMDIVLDGAVDGIDAGREIHERLDIPIVFITALSDAETLDRVKLTDPFGYLIKPFAERELLVMIDLALYRHQAKNRRMARERWFEATLRGIGDAVITTDESDHINFINPLAETFTGWSRAEALGRSFNSIIRLLAEPTRTEIILPDLADLAELPHDASEEPTEVILTSRQGDDRPVSYRLSLIRDTQNQPAGRVLVLTDLSHRREIEKHMLTTQKMEAIGKMAGTLAYEFDSVITQVRSYATSMLDHLLPNTHAHTDTLNILDTLRHAGLLTRRILGVARATSSDPDISISPVPLSGLILNAQILLEQPLTERRIKIQIDKNQDLPVVMADASRLLDILTDLFMCAADAMSNGGTLHVDASRTTISTPDPTLNPHAKPGPYVALRIRDADNRWPNDVLEHLFEPFYLARAQGVRIGLGLSVAQAAAQRFGGWIKAANKRWSGNTLTLFLPESTQRKSRPSSTSAPAIARILVVDDHEEVRTDVRSLLEAAGFQVFTAGGSEEALALIRDPALSFDLHLVDVIMPGSDCRLLLNTIFERDPAANIIMACGFSRDYVRSILPPGAWKFIQKPFDPESLVATIQRMLAQRIK